MQEKYYRQLSGEESYEAFGYLRGRLGIYGWEPQEKF